MRIARNIFGCQSGASAIELAVVLPVVATLVVGMSDLGLMGNLKYSLTKAANRSIELAMTNGPVDNKFEYLKSEAAEAAGVSVDAVSVENWLECEYVRQPDFGGSCTAPDLPFRYVKVTIASDYKSLFPGWVLPASNRVAGSATLRIQ